ncbi:MAG: hypothetical protein ACOVRB_08380 [Akkermansiaceae bacterium]
MSFLRKISLIILLTNVTVVSEAQQGGFGAKAFKRDAPSGRFSVRTTRNEVDGQQVVEMMDHSSGLTVHSFNTKARSIDAVWSPDSKYIAIEQNISTHHSEVSLFSITPKVAKRMILPKECSDQDGAAFDAPTRKRALIAEPLKFHFASEGLQVVQWSAADEIVLSTSGLGWWGGDVAKEHDTRFLAEYEITVHFALDGTSSLRKLVLKKYEVLQSAVDG